MNHNFTVDEKVEYDSLKAAGRSMYDDLRWYYGGSHDDAFSTAAHHFGFKDNR